MKNKIILCSLLIFCVINAILTPKKQPFVKRKSQWFQTPGAPTKEAQASAFRDGVVKKEAVYIKLSEVCTEANLAWESELGLAYHFTNEDGEIRTVFCYQVPFPLDKEAIFLTKYGMSLKDRLPFYQNFVYCLQRQVNISGYLASENVPSILTYSRIEQGQDEYGATIIYLETEQVWPIMDHLLVGSVPQLTILDVISRISLILRDINRTSANVTHRGLDMREVYISGKNKILMGGFYYAGCNHSEAEPYKGYLPCGPTHLPQDYLHGQYGSHKTDIQMLSAIAWNLLSGLPHDAVLSGKRVIVPEFSFDALTETLLLGLSGTDEIGNSFRRRLTDCRKMLTRGDLPEIFVPIRTQYLKTFDFC